MKASYQKPSNVELKKFGLLFSGFLVLLFGVLLPFIKHVYGQGTALSVFEYLPVWPWVFAVAIILWAIVHPASLFLLHRPWMKFSELAGWINTRIIMLVLFYFLIMPMGLLMRLFGYDSMCRKFDKNLVSYRVISKHQDKDHMKTPY